jgi:Zn-dependent peptidase ImmA (M78 family)
MGIQILYEPLGTHPEALKGFCVESNRIRCITVNSDLPECIQRVIIAHELCHAVNHRHSGVRAFHILNQTSVMEQDANLFAAELLLEDEEILNALTQNTTFFKAASSLYVPKELLEFKLRLLRWKGYQITESPILAHNDFLKQIDIPVDRDHCE